jgi:serine protease Do
MKGTLDPGLRHHWLFEGEEGEIVTIYLIAVNGDWDTFLELYAPDGDQVMIDDDSGGDSNAAILGFELPLTGSYRVVARGFSSFDTGEYELTLTKP